MKKEQRKGQKEKSEGARYVEQRRREASLREENQTESVEKYFFSNEWHLPTDITLLNAAEEEIRRRFKELRKAGWDDDDLGKMAVGFREILMNAIAYGNLGLSGGMEKGKLYNLALQRQKGHEKEKYVRVSLSITPEEVVITVRDEGKGFKVEDVPDPTKEENLLNTSGRGIFMTKNYFDEVKFDAHEGYGMEVTLIKRRKAA